MDEPTATSRVHARLLVPFAAISSLSIIALSFIDLVGTVILGRKQIHHRPIQNFYIISINLKDVVLSSTANVRKSLPQENPGPFSSHADNRNGTVL
jgi:hypothetical protein